MADGLVDGVVTSPDIRNIIQGDGGAVDKIAGSSSNDMLQGHAKFNQYYGGAGNDTFKLVSHFAVENGTHDGVSTAFADQFAYITDFEGAGQAGGDFINLTGFKAGSLSLNHVGASGTAGAVLLYYSVEDNAGNTFNFEVNSLSGKALGAGDFNFY